MAGKGFLGNLYYSITGEDKLEEILRKDKKLAEEVAKIAGGIKIGRTTITNDYAKTLVAEQKAAEAQARAEAVRNESMAKTAIFEQRLQTEMEKTNAARVRAELAARRLSKTEDTAAGSIKMLEAELKKLKDTYRSLAEADRNSLLGQTMLKEINNADENLAKINSQMANNANLAKAMGTQYNGLRTQIGMVARELPNLGISLSTFILSLSNNLPYLADEIAKARKEYDNLIKTNQKATPVWKQMIGAVFNWQTALIVGVTALVAYSREIQAWVQEMFASKKAIDANIESLEEFQNKVAQSNAGVMATFESLKQKWDNLGDSIEEKNGFIRDSQKEFDKLGISITNVDEATSVFNSNTDDFIRALDARAKAAAAMDLAAEGYKNAINKMMEAENAQIDWGDKIISSFATSALSTSGIYDPNMKEDVNPESIFEDRKKRMEQAAKDALDESKKLVSKYIQYTEEEQNILESLGIKSTNKIVEGSVAAIEASIALKRKTLKDLTNPEDYKEGLAEIEKLEKQIEAITGSKKVNIDYNKLSKDVLNASKAIEDAVRKSERDIEQTRINLMEEGGEKQLAQLKLNFQKRMDAVSKQTDEYIKMVQDQELKAWKEKNPTKKESEFVPQTTDFNTLPKYLQDIIVEKAQLANKEYDKNTQDLINNLLKKWGDYGDKRAALEAETADKIKQVNSVRNLIGDDAADRAIKTLERQLKEGINALESESLKLTPFYQQLFGDIANYGNAMLRSLTEQTRNLLAEAQKGGKNSKGTYSVEVEGQQIELTEGDIARLQKRLGEMDRQMSANNPFTKLKNAIRDYKYASSDTAKDQAFKEQLESISAIAGGLSQSLSGLQDTLHTLGVDSPELDAVFGGLSTTLDGLSSIDITKPFSIITGSLKAVGGLFQTIFNPRQAKLQKIIENSQRAVKKLQSAYESLERVIDRQLGATTEKQAKQQIENLQQQRAEVQKQMNAENEKKKKDKEALLDYQSQLTELDEQIRYFYEDLATEQFGIDIKGWADELAGALTDAFAAGEDAAVAFDDTVANIMKNVIDNMISLYVLQPAMEKLRKYLFGEDGKGGILGDGELSDDDAAGLVKELADLKGSIAEGKKIWDFVNKAAEEAGIDLQGSTKNSLSKGIQGVTEDTAGVIGSYISAMRADLSVNRNNLQTLVDNAIPFFNEFALRVADLKHLETIANNTGRNADIAQRIEDILSGVITTGNNGKCIKIK